MEILLLLFELIKYKKGGKFKKHRDEIINKRKEKRNEKTNNK